MFTGKNKEDFNEWLIHTKSATVNMVGTIFNFSNTDSFIHLPFSMQSGVYLEYLDSVGYFIDISQTPSRIGKFEYFIWHDSLYSRIRKTKSQFTSRQEALTEAFKKVDELINKAVQ